MSVETELQERIGRLQTAFTAANTAITGKGGTAATDISGLADAIGTIPTGGSPTINGALYDCGEFTLDTDSNSSITVSHNLGVAPSAAFVWVVDPQYADIGASTIGKIRFDSGSYINSVGVVAVNHTLSSGTGSNSIRYRTDWTSNSLTIICDSIYPIRAGLRYQWLAIGTEVTSNAV